jgi:hypothetical protein
VAISRAFDGVFQAHRGELPLAFVRALAYSESRLDPLDKHTPATGSAWGLMQVVDIVRREYNERHGTSYTSDDRLNPAVNVRIACDLLGRIVRQYRTKHPRAPNLQTDWGNLEFVKLVIAGWNSGYAETRGVGLIAHYLEGRGIPVTHDAVFAHAAATPGAKAQNFTDAKRAWQRKVAERYFLEGGPDTGVNMVASLPFIAPLFGFAQELGGGIDLSSLTSGDVMLLAAAAAAGGVALILWG